MSLVNIDQAVDLLKDGHPVALPTETVYGLASPINNKDALQKVFELKKRPLTDPLIVHAANIEMALNLFENPSKRLKKLAEHFWPGPLTLVAKKNKSMVPDLITSNMDTVAVRIPQSKIFREVIKKVNTPLAAPSANLFKKVSPTTAQHVLNTLPNTPVISGDDSEIGIESTIFDVGQSIILRPGHITHSDIEKVILKAVYYNEQDFTPGSEKDHYQPNTPVLVFENKEQFNDYLQKNKTSVALSLNSNPELAAKNFYKQLRDLDKETTSFICIFYDKAWDTEKWTGLKNRILKASKEWNI
jgi:L-threonylcarbamoyladenylate synthase